MAITHDLIRYEQPEYALQVKEQLMRLRKLRDGKKGQAKGQKQLSTLMKHALDIIYVTDPTLEPELYGLTYREVIILRVLDRAARTGDLGAFDRIIDRLEGKPVQKQESQNTEMNYLEYLMEIDRKEKEETNEIEDLYESPDGEDASAVPERSPVLRTPCSEN